MVIENSLITKKRCWISRLLITRSVLIAVLVILPCSMAYAAGTSNYVIGTNVIVPSYSVIPAKGQSVTDPVTGAVITRMTDRGDPTVTEPGLLIVYSRFSPSNNTGEYFLAHGENSSSCWVYRASDKSVVTKLRSSTSSSSEIGENHEIRWDYSGSYPTRVYFIVGTKFFKMDVLNQDGTRTLIHDFSADYPGSTSILNDVEGDSSVNSRFWAFMVLGSSSSVTRIITFDAVENKILGVLRPQDVGLSGTTMPRPNMVEISPRGTKVITHYARTGNGSLLDGPYAWNLDFTDPIKVGYGEEHSGWAFDNRGNEMYVAQNNSNDWLEARNIYTGETIQIINYTDFGYNTGFHYARVYSDSKRGWIFISTYGSSNNGWSYNQLLMVELKPSSQNPRVWRISPTYNRSGGDYRDEAPAALSTDGNRVFWHNNWGGNLGHREVFSTELPSDWHQHLSPELQSTVNSNTGPDQRIIDADGNGSVSVQLDGTLSTSSAGPITSYIWRIGKNQIASGSMANVTLPVGVHVILLETSNGTHTDIGQTIITVVSTGSPPPPPPALAPKPPTGLVVN
jgi:hypothetical protein